MLISVDINEVYGDSAEKYSEAVQLIAEMN